MLRVWALRMIVIRIMLCDGNVRCGGCIHIDTYHFISTTLLPFFFVVPRRLRAEGPAACKGERTATAYTVIFEGRDSACGPDSLMFPHLCDLSPPVYKFAPFADARPDLRALQV